MTGRTNVGGMGGGTVLGVAYPAGAVCTAAQGSITLRAKDTSGYMIFFLPSGGDWVISATLSEMTKSTTVSVEAGRVNVAAIGIESYFVQDGQLQQGTTLETPVYPPVYGVSYNGRKCIQISMDENGQWGGNKVARLTGIQIPAGAQKINIELVYWVGFADKNIYTYIGINGQTYSERKSVTSGEDFTVSNAVITFDAAPYRGKTVFIEQAGSGYAYHGVGYLGNIWVE